MDDKYTQLLAFLKEAEKLKSTLRHNWTTSGRHEDSSQHSWRAALFFIIAHKMFNFDVDPYKTLVMLLIHDIPELTHGDIPGFKKTTDPQAHAEHKKRESLAARELFSTAPSPVNDYFISLHEEFDKKETNEAKVAHVIEKLESQLQHLESGPQYWSEEETGDHMLHYPDKVVSALDNVHMKKIWKIIHKEIYALTYPESKTAIPSKKK